MTTQARSGDTLASALAGLLRAPSPRRRRALGGVKVEGGELAIMAAELEISCLPADLPEYLEVDLQDVHIGTTLHISDIKLPKGVEVPALALGHDHDQPIANVHKSRVEAEEEKPAAE